MPTTTTQEPPALDYIFHPRSLAVAGISTKERGRGGGFVQSLQSVGFRGPIYLIHPTAVAIRGLKCYRRLVDVPDDVDYVISSVPARAVPGLLEDCIAKNVKVLHLYTAGFTETGDAERAKMEQAIISRAREAGIRLIGPNCMGLYVPSAGLGMMGEQTSESGPVGAVSQSGVNAGEITRWGVPRGLRFSKVISFGNGADLKAADFFDYMADDPETEIVAAYLEGIQDGPRLARAIRKLGAVKPTVILKAGRTEAGSRAANSHTASLAGSLQIFDGLCKQAGVVRVESIDELVDVAVTFRFVRSLPGPNLVVVGGGGGASVLAADDLAAAGLRLPPLQPETQEALARVTAEAGTSIRNPIDTMSLWDDSAFEATMAACFQAPNADAVLFHTFFDFMPGTRYQWYATAERQVATIKRLRDETGRRIVIAVRTGSTADALERAQEFTRLCVAAGIATYPSIARAGRALARLLEWQGMRE